LLIYFAVCKKIFGQKVALISLMIASFTNGFYKLCENFYANLFGMIFILTSILVMLSIEEGESVKKYIALGTILGLLFYIHNLSIFSFSIIFGVWFAYRFFTKGNCSKRLKSLISVSLPCLVIGSVYLFRFFFSDSNNINQGGTGLESLSRVSAGILLGQPYSAQEFFNDLWYFGFLIGWPTVIFGLIGLVLVLLNRKMILKKKLIFAAWFLVYLGLTQQKLLGLNLVPERYFNFLIFPIAAAAAWLMIKILGNLNSFSKVIFRCLLIFMVILPPLSKMVNSMDKESNFLIIDKQEIKFIDEIKPILKNYPNSVITFSDKHRYWFMNLAEDIDFLYAAKSLSCGFGEYKNLYSELDINTAELLSFSNQNIESQLRSRKLLLSGYENEFILIKENEIETYKNTYKKCVDDEKFTNNPKFFENIYSKYGLSLYRVKYDSL